MHAAILTRTMTEKIWVIRSWSVIWRSSTALQPTAYCKHHTLWQLSKISPTGKKNNLKAYSTVRLGKRRTDWSDDLKWRPATLGSISQAHKVLLMDGRERGKERCFLVILQERKAQRRLFYFRKGCFTWTSLSLIDFGIYHVNASEKDLTCPANSPFDTCLPRCSGFSSNTEGTKD